MLEGVLNTDANLPAFLRQFQPPFPVGMASQMGALQYMELSPIVRTFVPYIVFIDRNGIIRTQLTGGDMTDESQDKVFREIVENLVNESAGPAKPKAKRSSR